MEFWESITGIINLSIPVLDDIPALRAVLGVLLIFFVPGFAWTLFLYKSINIIERIILSIALSVALVTLLVLGLNLVLNVSVSGLTSLVIVVVITLIPLAIRYRQKLFRRSSNREVKTREE